MSTIDEDQIRERLKSLSQAEPAQEATDRAMQKVRETLRTKEKVIGGLKPTLQLRLTRLAAAAVLMIGLGYLGGRLSAPGPLDAEQLRADIESSLRASLEPAIRQDLAKVMDTRWDSIFAARSVELKDEFQQQVRRDLMEFAAQTLEYSSSRTDQRLAELARQFYAARVQDRQRTAEGLQYVGNGLVTLVDRTNELLSTQQN